MDLGIKLDFVLTLDIFGTRNLLPDGEGATCVLSSVLVSMLVSTLPVASGMGKVKDTMLWKMAFFRLVHTVLRDTSATLPPPSTPATTTSHSKDTRNGDLYNTYPALLQQHYLIKKKLQNGDLYNTYPALQQHYLINKKLQNGDLYNGFSALPGGSRP
jgi:hypothetical protein